MPLTSAPLVRKSVCWVWGEQKTLRSQSRSQWHGGEDEREELREDPHPCPLPNLIMGAREREVEKTLTSTICRATDFGTLGAEVSVLGVLGTGDTGVAWSIHSQTPERSHWTAIRLLMVPTCSRSSITLGRKCLTDC